MKAITYNQVIEAARFEFRRYGFRADGGQFVGKNQADFEFDAEPATGQMGFGMDRVTAVIELWAPKGADGLAEFPGEIQVLKLSVRYSHHDGGTNGTSARYAVKRQTVYGGTTVKLVRMEA